MLIKGTPATSKILTFLRDALIPLALALGLAAIALPAKAAEESFIPPMKVLFEPESDSAYSYRKVSRDKHINLMVYGFKDPSAEANVVIPKDRKKLSSFFNQHLKSLKRDYLGQNGTQ